MADAGKSIQIYLYLLERAETPTTGEWARCIVAATSETSARQIANEESGSEGYVWTDGFKTNLKKIGIAEDGVQGVILQSVD